MSLEIIELKHLEPDKCAIVAFHISSIQQLCSETIFVIVEKGQTGKKNSLNWRHFDLVIFYYHWKPVR